MASYWFRLVYVVAIALLEKAGQTGLARRDRRSTSARRCRGACAQRWSCPSRTRRRVRVLAGREPGVTLREGVDVVPRLPERPGERVDAKVASAIDRACAESSAWSTSRGRCPGPCHESGSGTVGHRGRGVRLDDRRSPWRVHSDPRRRTRDLGADAENPGIVSRRPSSFARLGAVCSGAGPRCMGAGGRAAPAGQALLDELPERTPTRSHIEAITPRLWLMNRIEVPNSLRSPRTRSSHLGLATVASSPVVGSSRISSEGIGRERHRDDHAAACHRELELVPPDHRLGIGDLDLAEHRDRSLAAPRRAPRRGWRTPRRSGCRSGGGIERRARILVTIETALERSWRELDDAEAVDIAAIDEHRPGADTAVSREVPDDRKRRGRLFAAGLAGRGRSSQLARRSGYAAKHLRSRPRTL